MQPEGLSEVKLIHVNEESGCDKKDEGVPEEVMSATTSHERNSQRDFMRLKVQRIKCWKVIQT